VFNDRNSNLVNLYRMVREFPLELQNQLRYTLNSREDYDIIKGNYTEKIRSEPKWAFVGIFADRGLSGTSTKKTGHERR